MSHQPPTLASKLGTTTHISGLLMKARHVGLKDAIALQNLAVQRGCRHYWHEGVPAGEPVSTEAFSNEELAIALLNIALPYDPHSIRCGAAMLGAEGNDVVTLARLAKYERSEYVVRYVAEAGAQYEPENAFWKSLLELIPATPPLRDGVLPHATRFVALNGYVRHRGPCIQAEWQRPRRKNSITA